MKETNTQKGITLIALIITIVVLLILAVVTINAIKGDGIIQYAKDAASDYSQAQEDEIDTIDSYLVKIEESMGKVRVGTIAEKNSTINGEIYSSTNPVIPAGFKAINTDTSAWDAESGPEVTKGLVISDGNSEFVWIPVPTLSEFAKETSGIDENGRTNYEGVLYDFKGTTATEMTDYGQSTEGFREPANLADCDNTTNLSIWTETLYQESFNKMVESVSKYSGFYVGRYETSLNGSIAQSKSGETPINDINWFRMYEYSLTYSSNNTGLGVQSEIIWGCQWDAMLRFILTGDEASHVTSSSNVSHDLSTSYLTGGTDYQGSIKYNDIASNIYDLEGNVREWTQEANENDDRVEYGGYYGIKYSPAVRGFNKSVNTSVYFGSRLTIYVKV